MDISDSVKGKILGTFFMGLCPQVEVTQGGEQIICKKILTIEEWTDNVNIIYRFYSGLGTPNPPSRVDTPKCPPLVFLIIK